MIPLDHAPVINPRHAMRQRKIRRNPRHLRFAEQKQITHQSLHILQAAINRFLEEHNEKSKTLHMDRRSRQNHRRRQTRAPSVRFDPLVINQ
jgi:hypothetical protein